MLSLLAALLRCSHNRVSKPEAIDFFNQWADGRAAMRPEDNKAKQKTSAPLNLISFNISWKQINSAITSFNLFINPNFHKFKFA